MNNTSTFWMPEGDLTEGQQALLSVQASAKPDPQVYQMMLASKLQALVNSDPQQARATLEMSQEQLPELWLISQEHPQTQWGMSLTSSDSMGSLLSRLDWSQPGQFQLLEQSDLQSLLEQLP